MTISKINHACALVEKGFNVVGSVPVVSMFSGVVRAALGKVQFVSGTVFAVVGFVADKVDKNHSRKWKNMTDNGVEHMIHGALNVLRGLGEAFLGWTMIGSLGLLTYQATTGFNPKFSYTTERSYVHLV